MYHEPFNLMPDEPIGGATPKDDVDPMTQLQIIHLPPDFRRRAAEARREYERRHEASSTDGGSAALTVLSLMVLAGLAFVYFTGIAGNFLATLEPATRQLAMIAAGAVGLMSLIWLIYAVVRSDEDARDYLENQM